MLGAGSGSGGKRTFWDVAVSRVWEKPINRVRDDSRVVTSQGITCKGDRAERQYLGMYHAIPNLAFLSAMTEEDAKREYWVNVKLAGPLRFF